MNTILASNSEIARSVHILLGSAGFLLGFVAIVSAKFGKRAAWHRWVGRGYGVCMIGMSVLAVPLSIGDGSTFLLVIGLLTLAWVVGGWAALRQWRHARRTAPRGRASKLLRTHLILMGSSYIAAWTAFLVNIEPLGANGVVFWLYALGPTVLGTVLIARTSRRYAVRNVPSA